LRNNPSDSLPEQAGREQLPPSDVFQDQVKPKSFVNILT